MTIGENIRKLRTDAGMSQEMLGRMMHLSRVAVTKWETDAAVPTMGNIERLSTIFGVRKSVIIEGRSNPMILETDDEMALMESFRKLDKTRRDAVLVLTESLAEGKS